LTVKTLRDLALSIWRKKDEPPDSILMVSHNVEEAVYIADRVIVMSGRPGHVVGEVKIDIPRPRSEHIRDPIYFHFVDEVMEMLNVGSEKR
jgi:NitT/TauT family transport system ATP-binding protein